MKHVTFADKSLLMGDDAAETTNSTARPPDNTEYMADLRRRLDRSSLTARPVADTTSTGEYHWADEY